MTGVTSSLQYNLLYWRMCTLMHALVEHDFEKVLYQKSITVVTSRQECNVLLWCVCTLMHVLVKHDFQIMPC